MIMEEVNDRCYGCNHLTIDLTCEVYQFPQAKWSGGNCPMNTHLQKVVRVQEKALDPIKASKKKMGR